MLNQISSLLMLLAISGFTINASSAPVRKEVTVAVSDVYLPENAVSTEDVRVLVSGRFPNSCYQWSHADVASPSDTLHLLRARALVTVNSLCLMVIVRFEEEVNLGRLVPGTHTLRVIGDHQSFFQKMFTVR